MRRQHFLASLPVPPASQELILTLRQAELGGGLGIDGEARSRRRHHALIKARPRHRHLKPGMRLEALDRDRELYHDSADYLTQMAAKVPGALVLHRWQREVPGRDSGAPTNDEDEDEVLELYQTLRNLPPPVLHGQPGRGRDPMTTAPPVLHLTSNRQPGHAGSRASGGEGKGVKRKRLSPTMPPPLDNKSSRATHHAKRRLRVEAPSVLGAASALAADGDHHALKAAMGLLPKLKEEAHEDEDLVRHAKVVAELQTAIRQQLSHDVKAYKATQAASLKQCQALEGDLQEKSKRLVKWRHGAKQGCADGSAEADGTETVERVDEALIFLRRKAIDTLAGHYAAIRLAYVEEAWRCWWRNVVEQRSTERALYLQRRHQAALVIKRHWRGYRFRGILRGLMQRREVVGLSLAIEEGVGRRADAMVQIQRLWRGHVGRRLAQEEKEQVAAAIRVQSAWRAFRYPDTSMDDAMAAWRRTRQGLLTFQALFRGHQARSRLGHVRMRRHHSATWKRFGAYDTIIEANLEHEGAAGIIQRYFRKMRSREVFRQVVFDALQLAHQATIAIQAMARGGRVRLTRRRLRIRRTWVSLLHVHTLLLLYIEQSQSMVPAVLSSVVPDQGEDPPAREAAVPSSHMPPQRRPDIFTYLMLTGKHDNMSMLSSLRTPMSSSPMLETKEEAAARAEVAASIIQRAYRISRAWRELQRLRHGKKRIQAVTRIVLWYRRAKRKWRRKVQMASAINITRQCRKWSKRQALRHSSALCLQRALRAAWQRRLELEHFVACLIQVQALARGTAARRVANARRAAATRDGERRAMGAGRYLMTCERARVRQVLMSATMTSCIGDGELQRIFTYYSKSVLSSSLSSNSEPRRLAIGQGQFVKFCGEFPDIINDEFDADAARGMFQRIRGGKALSYRGFMAVLQELADNKMEGIEAYGQRRGQEARLARYLMEVIFPSPMALTILRDMPVSASHRRRAAAAVLASVVLIQRVYKGCTVRRRLREERRREGAILRARMELLAAILLQRAWRGHKIRKIVHQLAKRMYEKCIDHTGASYYYNPRTGRYTWERPALLGPTEDIHNPIYIPAPDQAFTIICQSCNTHVAKRFCLQCNQYFCLADAELLHSSDMRAHYRLFPLDLCVQCTSQVATRECLKCKDLYCDACFHALHRRGHLRYHQYKMLSSPECESCKAFMATAQCLVCQSVFCTRCKNAHQQETEGSHAMEPLTYKPTALQLYEKEMEKEKRAKDLRERHQQTMANLRDRHRQLAATRLQRAWRGYRARKPLCGVLECLTVDNRQRTLDDRIRFSLVYKLLYVFGLAPNLKSDTHLERVLKHFPVWLHGLVKEVAEGDWLQALKETAEQDGFLLHHPWTHRSAQRLRDYLSLLSLACHRASLMGQRRLLLLSQAKKMKKLLKERDQEKKVEMRKELKSIKALVSKKERLLEGLATKWGSLQEHLDTIDGPDALGKRLQGYRRHGLKLPFRLQVMQGGRLCHATTRSGKVRCLQAGVRLRLKAEEGEIAAIFRLAGLQYEQVVKQHGETLALAIMELDRDWVDDGGEVVDAYRLPSLLPYQEHAEKLRYRATRTMGYQWGLYFCIRAAHSAAKRFRAKALLYDEGSKEGVRLSRWSEEASRLERHLMRQRVVFFDPSQRYSYGIKRMVADVRAWTQPRCQQAATILLHGWKAFKKLLEKSDLYALWEKSPDKVPLVVLYVQEDEDEQSQEVEVIGTIELDIDAPCSVLREKLRRRLRVELNQRHGEFFALMAGDRPLRRIDEAKTRSREVLKDDLNKATRELEHQVTLRTIPDSNFVEIPDPDSWALSPSKPKPPDQGPDEPDTNSASADSTDLVVADTLGSKGPFRSVDGLMPGF